LGQPQPTRARVVPYGLHPLKGEVHAIGRKPGIRQRAGVPPVAHGQVERPSRRTPDVEVAGDNGQPRLDERRHGAPVRIAFHPFDSIQCDQNGLAGTLITVDLEDAVRDLAPRVLRYCRLKLGDAALADDVAQEALTALVHRWKAAGPPDWPAAFVFAIARRRGARAVVRRRLLAPLDLIAGTRDGRPSPEAAAIDGQQRARVRAALARLPARERDTLLLIAAGEVTMAEAAVVLGVTPSAVKMRLSRARRRLVDWIGDCR
jgi:RNA polymerase sigma-70 factor (ECF subfamily)